MRRLHASFWKLLKAGEDYAKLKPQIIIFVCAFDKYKCGQYQYTFSNRCHEVDGLEMGDETKKIFLNTRGTKGKVSNGLKAFLRYVENSTPENAKVIGDPFVDEIAAKVAEIKSDDEKRGEFMTFEEIIERENEKVRKEVEAEKNREFALKMKCEELPMETIVRLTGLSEEEIEKL